MHNCKYCGRELKSKAGQLRHESSCKAREIGGQTEEEISELEVSVDYADGEDSSPEMRGVNKEMKREQGNLVSENEITELTADYADGEDSSSQITKEEQDMNRFLRVIDELNPKEEKSEVVQLEVMGGEETYYDGHPRRATKLKGLLSRTFDKRERHKIRQMIMKVENETYKG